MAEYSNLKVAVEDRVAVLTIDHPPANAFDTRRWPIWTRAWTSCSPTTRSR